MANIENRRIKRSLGLIGTAVGAAALIAAAVLAIIFLPKSCEGRKGSGEETAAPTAFVTEVPTAAPSPAGTPSPTETASPTAEPTVSVTFTPAPQGTASADTVTPVPAQTYPYTATVTCTPGEKVNFRAKPWSTSTAVFRLDPGTTVKVVHDPSIEYELTSPIIRIDETNKATRGWDPTDTDPRSPYNTGEAVIPGNENELL